MWLISWLSILLYPKLITILNLSQLDFTNTNNSWFQLFFFFWIYLSTLVFIVKFLFLKRNISDFFMITYIIFSIVFLLVWISWNMFIWSAMVLYYLFVALWEEFMKYLLWINFYEKFKISENDILIFTIISALWFAFVENIVYTIWWTKSDWLLIALVWWITILVTRWLIWFLVHTVFTGNIWLFTVKWLNWNILNMTKFITIWSIIWIWLHYFYNVMLYKEIKIVLLAFLIIWYFWISYLFYKADRIYVNDWLQHI